MKRLSGRALSLLSTFLLSGLVQANVVGNLEGELTVSEGQAAYTLPISVPKGLHDMAPSISLHYSQHGGPGVTGVGFSLNASSMISRCTPNKFRDDFAAGIQQDSLARFCHDGAELVAVSGENGGSNSEYRSLLNNNSRYLSKGPATHRITGRYSRRMAINCALKERAIRIISMPAGC